MKNITTITLGLTLSTLLLTACTPEIKKADSATVTVSSQQTSAELADAAEQLAGPFTFMLASRVADLALEKDATNLKAQFYKKLLARTEVFRGIQERVKPFLTAEQLKHWGKEKERFPESPLKNFLYISTAKPLSTVADVQDLMGEYIAALREFRSFLKANQNAELVVNLNPHQFEQKIRQDAIKDCQVAEDDRSNFSVTCETKEIARIRLNSADFVVLAQYAAGEMFFSGMYNNYSLTGVKELGELENTKSLTPKQRIEFLSANNQFGKLLKDNTITMIKEIGSDYSAAVKWAMKHQENLCPEGISTVDQRRGYLFSGGICIPTNTEAEQSLAMLDKALSGVIQLPATLPNTEEVVQMNVNVFAWATTPIADLRSIAPIAYNECGKATALQDKSLGGVFVDRTADLLLDTKCN